MDQMKIGKFITTCRKEKHITQQQLAELLDVSTNAISKWERGLCLMDIRLVQPLSQILGVSVNELLSGEKILDVDYKQKAESNLIDLAHYNHYKSIFMGTVFLLCIIAFLLIYSMIKGLESSGYAALLFGFSALTYYSKYKLTKDKSLVSYWIIMMIIFIIYIIKFIFISL